MRRTISLVTLVVRDYDEAIAFYVDVMGFVLVEDRRLDHEKRWITVAPAADAATRLLLARAVNDAQLQAIGRQAGGRVCLFLETDDFERDYAEFRARGVHFAEAPRQEPYGLVAVFEDLYGNRWDLIQHGIA